MSNANFVLGHGISRRALRDRAVTRAALGAIEHFTFCYTPAVTTVAFPAVPGRIAWTAQHGYISRSDVAVFTSRRAFRAVRMRESGGLIGRFCI